MEGLAERNHCVERLGCCGADVVVRSPPATQLATSPVNVAATIAFQRRKLSPRHATMLFNWLPEGIPGLESAVPLGGYCAGLFG
jgi:hypothetical protein